MTPRRKHIHLIIAGFVAVLALTTVVSCGTGSTGEGKTAGGDAGRTTSSRFYVAAMGFAFMGNWEGLIRSDGRRYTIPHLTNSVSPGSFSPDRATVVVGYHARGSKRWFSRIVNLGGSSRVVATEPQTAPPVFGPDDEIAYASGATVHYLDGKTIRARGLPKGAEIIKLELSPEKLVAAALVTWGSGGEYTPPNEALYVISPDGSHLIADGLNALSEQPDPLWSPTGDEIAFARLVGADPAIFVVRSDGSDLRRISHNADNEGAYGPVWSPDGTRLAYTQLDLYQPKLNNAVREVYAADLHGHTRRLTDTPALPPPIGGRTKNLTSPGSLAGAWSPDGRLVAVVTGEYSVGVVLSDGGKERVLMKAADFDAQGGLTPFHVWWPSVAP